MDVYRCLWVHMVNGLWWWCFFAAALPPSFFERFEDLEGEICAMELSNLSARWEWTDGPGDGSTYDDPLVMSNKNLLEMAQSKELMTTH